MSELPEGAREAVEELVESLAEPLDRWLDSTDKSENFKKSALMCAHRLIIPLTKHPA